MKIKSVAPMRADLAGGTLDIYPLYVFMGEAVTLNAALTLTSTVTVETKNGTEIRLFSEDLNIEQTAPRASELDVTGPLGFIARIVKYYNSDTGLDISTRNNVPKGSGLGASSTLLIAVSHALNELKGRPRSAEDLINTGCNIEAESIQVPAGKQDYYSATYGSLSAIHFTHDGARHEHIAADETFLNELDNRMIVSFAGEPRFSGASNWNMFKSYIDRDARARENLDRIKSTAFNMLDALKAQNIPDFIRLINDEWEHRRSIADGVSNAEIESMMKAASDAGALASKICGAGGGGCMVTFAEPADREKVRAALASAGAMLLDCTISRKGVEVTQL